MNKIWDKVREEIADKAHQIWQKWMAYMLPRLSDKAFIERWKRQANTAYKDLPDTERASDRAIADEYLAIEGVAIVDREAELPKNPYITLDCNGKMMGYDEAKSSAYGRAQYDMAGYVKEEKE